MTHLGIVVGMADEAALLASLVAAPPDGGRMSVRVAGARPGRARTLADGLAADGVDALMSFGVAGGIDPALRPGTLIVASSVVHPGATVQPTDARWRAALRGALPGALEGPIVGSQRALADVRDKRDHGAVIVHGHTPQAAPEMCRNRINLDTGAFQTGRLTCAVLDGREISFLQT